MSFHINRSHNLADYLKDKGWHSATPEEMSKFSYWDTYSAPEVNSEIKVWNKTGFSAIVDCLYSWHKRLEKLNLTHLAPYTITDWENHRLGPEDFQDGGLWFFKQIFGVHGKGINLISTYEDYQKIFQVEDKSSNIQGPCLMEALHHEYILQKGIRKSHLIKGGYKYNLRVYSLTKGTGETYAYNDALLYCTLFPLKYDNKDCYVGKNNKVYPLTVKDKSGKTFVPKKQMRKNVHVSHWKVAEEGEFNITDTRKMCRLSDLPQYKTIMRNLFQNIREMSLLFTDILEEYKRCPEKPFHTDLDKIYQIWGSDYIVQEDLSVKCLEINAFPMLSHGDPHKGQSGSKKRPHEIAFRKAGFDRDLMRLFGYNFENTDKPNNWVQVNQEFMNMPIEKLHLQRVRQKKKSKKKSIKRKSKRK
jgi:hypothetical protein